MSVHKVKVQIVPLKLVNFLWLVVGIKLVVLLADSGSVLSIIARFKSSSDVRFADS